MGVALVLFSFRRFVSFLDLLASLLILDLSLHSEDVSASVIAGRECKQFLYA